MGNASPRTVSMHGFKHEPLPDAANHIRLLEVLDDNYSETIKVRCRITTWPVDKAPQYHAISYTWGDPESNKILLIDDKTFQVRTNCEYVLKQAHWHGQSRYYWIDAICIDQKNLEEKGEQVAMMGNIYKAADHVLASVGDHADDSLLLYQACARISEISKRSRRGFNRVLFILCWNYETSTVRRCLRAAVHFAKRPYFTRLWILQELFNAKAATVLCGPDGLSKMDLHIFFYEISYFLSLWIVNPFPKVFSTLCALQEWVLPSETPQIQWWSINPPPTMYPCIVTMGFVPEGILLHRLNMFQCTHRRDKLYGVISIIDWGDFAPPVPSYTKTDFEVASEFIQPILGFKKRHYRRSEPFGACNQVIRCLGLSPETDGVSDGLEARKFEPGSVYASLNMQAGDSTTQLRSMANGWQISGKDLNKENPGFSIWQPPGVFQPKVYLPRWVEEGDWILELNIYGSLDKIVVIREVAEGLGGPIVGRGLALRTPSKRSAVAFQVLWDPEDLLLLVLARSKKKRTPENVKYGVCKRQNPGSSYATRQICS